MSTQFPLADIAAAQAAGSIMAFDLGHLQRTLARRQQIYATRLPQLDALSYAFDEGNVEIMLQSDTKKLILRLGEAAQDIYPALRDALDEQLRTLESEIVGLHLELEKVALDDVKYPTTGPDYVPDILTLCTPESPQTDAPKATLPIVPSAAPRRITDASNASRRTHLGNRGFDTKATVAA